MKLESQKDRFARLQRYVDAGTYCRGVHRDPQHDSEYRFFAVWRSTFAIKFES